jgi:hypothetical protein
LQRTIDELSNFKLPQRKSKNLSPSAQPGKNSDLLQYPAQRLLMKVQGMQTELELAGVEELAVSALVCSQYPVSDAQDTMHLLELYLCASVCDLFQYQSAVTCQTFEHCFDVYNQWYASFIKRSECDDEHTTPSTNTHTNAPKTSCRKTPQVQRHSSTCT